MIRILRIAAVAAALVAVVGVSPVAAAKPGATLYGCHGTDSAGNGSYAWVLQWTGMNVGAIRWDWTWTDVATAATMSSSAIDTVAATRSGTDRVWGSLGTQIPGSATAVVVTVNKKGATTGTLSLGPVTDYTSTVCPAGILP